MPGAGPRGEKPAETGNKTVKENSNFDPKGQLTVKGQGAKQTRPDPKSRRQTTAEQAVEIGEAREKATEAMRSQRLPAAQQGVVSEFYKNLAPEKEKR